MSSVEAVDNGDPRVFAEILLKNKLIKGLLDTGASVSLLGRGCDELLKEINIKANRYNSNVITAAGKSHKVRGKISLPVKYREQVHNIIFYLCPSLEQVAYLGIDFWRTFNLAPDVLDVADLNMDKINMILKSIKMK